MYPPVGSHFWEHAYLILISFLWDIDPTAYERNEWEASAMFNPTDCDIFDWLKRYLQSKMLSDWRQLQAKAVAITGVLTVNIQLYVEV